MVKRCLFASGLVAFAAAGSPHLVKVIGLGRHGNREANAEVDALCPKAGEYIPFIKDSNNWEAALTSSGEIQCMMAGRFLHNRYVDELAHLGQHASDDHSTFFYADASDRNIACLDIAKRSIFSGNRAGEWNITGDQHNAVIPVVTTKLGHDKVLRLPKYYQCSKKVKSDSVEYGKTQEPTYKSRHRALLSKLSDVCGFDFDSLICGDKENGKYGGKCLSWGLKSVDDAIGFAKFEGYDWSLGGQLSEADRIELKGLAKDLIVEQDLRLDSQVTYTFGEFPEKALFHNMRKPKAEEMTMSYELQSIHLDKMEHPWDRTPLEFFYHNKFLLFWNHRELITGLLYLFNGTDESGAPINPFPSTGAMILWELYEDDDGLFIRFYMWELNSDPTSYSNRSLPWPHVKPNVFANIHSYSTLTEIFPNFCSDRTRCSLESYEAALDAWNQKTGTWQEICGAEEEAGACASPVQLAEARAELAKLRAELATLRVARPELAETPASTRGYGYLMAVCSAAAAAALVATSSLRRRAREQEDHLESGYLGMSG